MTPGLDALEGEDPGAVAEREAGAQFGVSTDDF